MKKLLPIFLTVVLIILQMDVVTVFADTTSGNYKYSVSGSTATITNYIGSEVNVNIPSKIDGYTVTSIGDYAFCGCRYHFGSVTIPSSVTSIGDFAFEGCSDLTNVTIQTGVISIGDNAFVGCGSLINVTIPNSVTSIGNSAFSGCYSLINITIPSSVTSIGDSAFEGCRNLNVDAYNTVYSSLDGALYNKLKTTLIYYPTSKSNSTFVIPSSVTSIGKAAFEGCSYLTSITIPSSVTSIGDSAFQRCYNLTSIIIPSNVTSIGNSAFKDCSSLTNITIPNSVTKIGDGVFSGCTKLITIDVNAQNTAYSSLDGVIYNKLKTTIISYPAGKSNLTFVIPSSVTSIGNYTFYDCSSLASIIIPSNVTSIGSYAFYSCCKLTDITIPSGVTSIGNYAFYYCHGLTNITIPNNVTSIGNYAFINCSKLTNLTIPSCVTSIGNHAFFGCNNLINIIIPNSVKSIGDSAFANCSNLPDIKIPNSVTSIGNSAFDSCSSLANITIPSSVTSISDYAFACCSSLKSITIPSSVTNIGDGALWDCPSLTSITIPSSVKSIGSEAFASCNSLTSVEIPSSVTSIGDCAFNSCAKLITIDVNAQNTTYSSLDGVLYNKLKTTLISYPVGKTNLTFVVPSSVTSIGNSAFEYCSSLTSITIPSSVTSIGNNAFLDCSSLTSITIPSSVTSIGNGTFEGCNKLTSITIPYSVTSIGYYAFGYCSSLTNITIPNSVTSIDNGVFFNCRNLTKITIPNSVISIGKAAFEGCSNLMSITIPSSVTSIGDYAFANCPSNLIIYYHNTAIGFTNLWHGFKTVPYNMVSYNGNGNTAGTVPVDNSIYTQGTKATILKNTGSLVRTGYIFAGWNTAANGSGTSYPAGSIVSMNGSDITLYAQWIAISQSISPASGTFIKTAPADLTAVITAPYKAANPAVGVYNGTTKLVAGANESVVPTATGYTLTLYKSYLSKLTVNTPITIKFKDGSTLTYTVVLGATISPAAGTFTKTAPTNLTTVITAPYKSTNPAIGVYNGTTRLVAGTDESVVPTATGYTLTLYKSYLSKLTSNAVITVKFKNGFSLDYTVNVK